MTNIRSPYYANATQTLIDCEIEVAGNWLPFTASAADPDQTGRDIHARLLAGKAGAIAPYRQPAPPTPQSVTFRQLVLAMLASGFLTEEEALLAAETRARPPALEAVIASLSPSDALEAKITWATMTEAQRNHRLFAALVATGTPTAEQIDDVFRLAATL